MMVWATPETAAPAANGAGCAQAGSGDAAGRATDTRRGVTRNQ
jgi:hypothetical protein